MAYELHIERSFPITVDEWLAAVEATENLKIDGIDSIATNSMTGAEIRIPNYSETAAVWFLELEKWIKVFRFQYGRILFNANDWDNKTSPVRIAALALAKKLDAEIFGDEGEKY